MKTAISSHRDYRSSKMRFLIVSTILACATAAPSGFLAPVPVPAVPALVYSAAVPTISPGDVQAAVIDAQVKAYDEAILAADKARQLSEQATENQKSELTTGSDIVKESSQEGFWSVQDKQWQALDALKTAEAQLDGAVASNAPILAKNAVLGPYLTGLAPISPIVYTTGIVAPAVKTTADAKAESDSAEPAKVEEEKTEEKNEALTKTAEEMKEEKDSVAIEASKENLEAKPQLAPAITPYAIHPFGHPIIAPVALSPVLNYGTFPQIALYPAFGKTGW